MGRKCRVIACVIMTLTTLVAVGGLGLAYHYFVEALFVTTDNEVTSGAIQNCVPCSLWCHTRGHLI